MNNNRIGFYLFHFIYIFVFGNKRNKKEKKTIMFRLLNFTRVEKSKLEIIFL